jgi:hypothetical protein
MNSAGGAVPGPELTASPCQRYFLYCVSELNSAMRTGRSFIKYTGVMSSPTEIWKGLIYYGTKNAPYRHI